MAMDIRLLADTVQARYPDARIDAPQEWYLCALIPDGTELELTATRETGIWRAEAKRHKNLYKASLGRLSTPESLNRFLDSFDALVEAQASDLVVEAEMPRPL